jgi:phosphonopyruvate decarboxylase
MISAAKFVDDAARRGFDFYTSVPCSFLTPLINAVVVSEAVDHVGAASEGEAVAIASGAWLAGRRTVVMCQNSGLGNAVNPLTSLNVPFRIPTLLLVTWRGQPGLKDEPQHVLMGQITHQLLETIRVPWRDFSAEPPDLPPLLDVAAATMSETSLPFALVIKGDAISGAEGESRPPLQAPMHGERIDLATGGALPSRAAALERFLALVPGQAAVIATTGKCGRELFTLADRPQHLYQVGSMGGASAMALGVALNTARPVVVLDGDGAALMKLGNLATIGAKAPRNLIHVLLDNSVYDSTGGQATASPNVDFAAVAIGCGYRCAFSADDLGGFEAALTSAFAGSGPTLICLKIGAGSMAKLGRPTITPPEVARRFQAFLQQR